MSTEAKSVEAVSDITRNAALAEHHALRRFGRWDPQSNARARAVLRRFNLIRRQRINRDNVAASDLGAGDA